MNQENTRIKFADYDHSPMTCLLEAFASCFTFVYFEMDLRFLKMLVTLFFLPLQTLDTLTLPYNLVQPHTINKDVM